MNWTEDQKKVIDIRDCNLLVSAAAGSGKTAVLVERILQMVMDKENPVDVDSLLVVTFTNAAAAQMREKISQALYELQEENPADAYLAKQLSLIPHASIMTIDSFCLQVVRDNFQMLGLEPGFRIAEASELASLESEAMSQVLEHRYQTLDSAFLEFVDCYGGDKSDIDVEKYITGIVKVAASYPRPYDWIQKAEKALDVENGDSLEKSPWYQKMVANVKAMAATCIQDTQYVESLCGSPGGPVEFKETCVADRNIMQAVIAADSYHALQLAFSEKFPRARGIKKESCDSEKAEQVKKLRKQYKESFEKLNRFQHPIEVLLADLENVGRHMTLLLSLAEEYMRVLEQKKLEEGVLDFADVEHFALAILVDEAGATDVAKQYQDRYNEILIDEYQDSNFLQEEILTSISRMSSGKNNMFMVGDVKQSIYKFRMARPDLFMKKYEQYTALQEREQETGNKALMPEEDHQCNRIELKNNFRSRSVVLEGVNYIFYQIMGKDFGGIDYDENAALVPGLQFPEGQGVSVSTELLVLDRKPYAKSQAESEEEKELRQETEEKEEADKVTLEAKLVANRILELTGIRGNRPLYILGEDGKHYRKAVFGDIAILLRSMKNMAPVFIKELSDAGIPAASELSQGLFETQEISTLLNCLRVIHNPYQDIELTALLHSPLFSVSSEELAKIRIHGDKVLQEGRYFYDAVCQYDSEGIRHFLALLRGWQEKSRYMDTVMLLSEILKQTNYLAYLQVLEGGERRLANVYYLISCAKKYSENGRYGIYDFICYIDRLKDARLDMGEANVHGEHDNIVRIMSMHKSKGLEFPVVFVSGLGKQFNQTDSRERIIIHPDDYLAADYADVHSRTKRDTFMRSAFAENIRMENIAEEFRVFYVALTRAREKLILTGSIKDFSGKVDEYGKIASVKERKLPFGYRREAKTYLDWVIMSLIRNPEFHKYVSDTLPASGRMRRCEYTLQGTALMPGFHLDLQIFREADFLMYQKAEQVSHMFDVSAYFDLKRQPWDSQRVEDMKGRLSYSYPYAGISQRKSKYSVTELKAAGGEPERSDTATQTIPAFMQGKVSLSGAARGTLIHRMLLMFDFTKALDADEIRAVIKQWIAEDTLPEDILDYVDISEFTAFFESVLGKRMSRAAKEGVLYKERQFTIMVPLQEVDDEAPAEEEEQVLVQGIIDAYFINEKGNIEIVDYKTDRGALPMEQYQRQLLYYANTLERLTHRQVEQCYVYAFTHKETIPIMRT